MPVIDPIGVQRNTEGFHWHDAARQAFNSKLQEMRREMERMQSAIRELEMVTAFSLPITLSVNFGIGQLGAFLSRLAQAKRSLRGWLVSLVESVGFVEGALGKNLSTFEFSNMVSRAGSLGVARGIRAKQTASPAPAGIGAMLGS
jgi:hypothetical protein